MGQLKSLVPTSKSGSVSSTGVSVSGSIVKFSKDTVALIGAENTIQFQIGGDNDDRLYIRTGVPQVAEFKLLGKPGGRRYVNDIGLVKAAKLQSQGYPMLYDDELKAHYIQFDPNAEWSAPSSTRKPRTPEQIAAAKAKYEAKKAAEKAAKSGAQSTPAKTSGKGK